MKKCVIIVNTFNSDAVHLADEIEQFLLQYEVISTRFLYSGINGQSVFVEHDFAVTLGGDGTVLFAARACATQKIPIFPINLGQFGFIAGIQKNDWKNPLEQFINGELRSEKRSMIRVEIIRGGATVFNSFALNDVVISGRGAARIISLLVSCNGISFGKFKSDGIIAATATGSTAYSAAAGGPIVDPALDAIILSPICPFSLSNRPLVLPASSLLEISVMESRGAETVVTCDGQIAVDAEKDDIIVIQKAEENAVLAGCDSRIFYSALKSKLNWSGGPRD